jgi:hypothetical protein
MAIVREPDATRFLEPIISLLPVVGMPPGAARRDRRCDGSRRQRDELRLQTPELT